MKKLIVFYFIFSFLGCDFFLNLKKEFKNSSQKSDLKGSHRSQTEVFLESMEGWVFTKNSVNTLDRKPWENVFNQGSSWEGIYRAWTRGDLYRSLEKDSKAASPQALNFFASEMHQIQNEMKNPTILDSETSRPPEVSSETKSRAVFEVIDFTPNKKPLSEEELKKVFLESSSFTLKRVLCEEVLKLLLEKNEYREKLGIWSSKWLYRISQNYKSSELNQDKTKNEWYEWTQKKSFDELAHFMVRSIHLIMNSLNEAI